MSAAIIGVLCWAEGGPERSACDHHAATAMCSLNTVALFCQLWILRNVIYHSSRG
jgi:hypothetical protein